MTSNLDFLKEYDEFVRSKIDMVDDTEGLEIDPERLHPSTFPHQRDVILWALRKSRALIAMSFGLGKCHGAGTKIMMHDATVKLVEDVQVGDHLMGSDGKPRLVTSLARGRESMYRIVLKNGDSYTCNESHVMALTVSNGFYGHKKGETLFMTVGEYLQLPEYIKHNSVKHFKVGLDFAGQDVPMDPYLYGAWIGDGHCGMLGWTINDADPEIVAAIREFADTEGMEIYERDGRGCKDYFVRRKTKGRAEHHPSFYFVQSSSSDDGKRIDRRYLVNDVETRLELLAGIIDTDGYLIDKCYEVVTKWEGLRDDILFLVRSLGLSVTHGTKNVDGVEYFRIYISGDTHLIPCRTRKKAGVRTQNKRPLVYGFDVKPLGAGDYYGFTIDGDHLYLLADFTVTHNTHVQIEMMRMVHEETGGKTLIICPLGVKSQFSEEDGPRLGVRIQYVRTDEEVEAADTPYLITNYERLREGNISPHHFVAVSLDEGSILRNLGSKTYQTFIELFADTPFRWVSTATPSPNNYKEIIYYAQFLGLMDAGQALTRWFKRDPSQAGNLTIHPHHEKDFWLWVSSWALFVTKPSDLGYSDDGYDLPGLKVHWHRITTDHRRAWEVIDRTGQRSLFMDSASGVTQASKEKRETIDQRILAAMDIIENDGPDKHWLLWHHLEAERHAIKRALPEAVDVYGSQELELRERRILDFAHGKIRILATKPEIAGSGCNFQRYCYANIFLGVRYQFEEFIQAVHRTHRFQQAHDVEVHVIHTDAEDAVVDTLQRKWHQHDELVKRMTDIVKQYGLIEESMKGQNQRAIGVLREVAEGQMFTAVHNDCVDEVARMADESVDLIHTSIPFGNQYEYSANYNDFGHNDDDERFFEQMDYLIPHLHRILKPGRICAIHVKDRLLYGHQTQHGTMALEPFSDKTTVAMRKHGFIFFGRITVVTDVVRENASTYRLGWSENAKDSTKMGVGMPEYVMLYRKLQTDRSRSYSDEPVTKDKETYTRADWQIDAHQFWRSSGDRLLRPEDIPHPDEMTADMLAQMETGKVYRWFREWSKVNVYDHEAHVAVGRRLEEAGRLPSGFMALPLQAPMNGNGDVWTDVSFMHTLNSQQSQGRRENHLCPLPLDIVKRIINRYSNPGELVLDPFGGLMTVPYQAILMGRKGIGIELNRDYWEWGARYCREAEIKATTPTLFDLLEDEDEFDEMMAMNGAACATTVEDCDAIPAD